MHPQYKKTLRKIRVVGVIAVCIGVIGLVSPFIPGLVLVIVGFSVLSLQSNRTYEWIASLRSRHPELSKHVQTLETWVANFFNLSTHTYEFCKVPRREGDEISALLEISPINTGVAILVHSATSTMETVVMQTMAEALRARGYTVVRFDAYNGLEGKGAFVNFSGSELYKDLEEVIAWARSQEWFRDELTLAGHSIGGLVAAHYAARHTEQVRELVLFAPMISGDSYLQNYQHHDPQGLEQWQKEGERLVTHPLSGETCGLAYSFVRDACTYNLYSEASLLTMPTCVVVGTSDETVQVRECVDYVKAIGPHASSCILQGVSHNPKHRTDLKKVYKAIVALPALSHA